MTGKAGKKEFACTQQVMGISNRFRRFTGSSFKLDEKSWNRFHKTTIYLLKRFRKKHGRHGLQYCLIIM
jgi:hypothetical protein